MSTKNVGRPRKIEKLKLSESPFCPSCGNQGDYVSRSDIVVTLKCDCGEKWKIRSGICPHCDGYNGYPADGVCMNCYRKGLRTVDVAV